MACTSPNRTVFENRFPEFTSEILDAHYTSNANIFCCYFSKSYGADTCSDEAILLIIAHLITIDQKATNSSGTIKDVASKSVEGVSISYNVSSTNSSSDLFFNSTTYGQRFLQLTRFNHGGVFV